MTVKKKSMFRTVVQALFFVIVALIAINHSLEESGKALAILSSASLHAICPFGGVVTFYQYITEGTLVRKLHESTLILMYLVLFLSVLFGPVFCGWVCPLGTIQEFLGKLGRNIFKEKYNNFIPHKIDKYLQFVRYAVLIWVVYVTTVTGKIFFQDIDPFYALFNFWTGDVATGALLILLFTLIGSLLVERPWCKYACPYGAFLGITNIFRIFKIRRKESTCIQCRKCDSVCPMNIRVSEKKVVRNHQCITCLNCTSQFNCPVNETVDLELKGGK